ncbi:MAG: outer membrane lipid asymmetry maintenance protein MlaD [Alphaproteobacteria bacterium]|nr:outer membrane lipid asymmetry maintenance protein MlaD [Alphaproteobacteria bacterium]|tara:strand:- start:4070 stop:4630 length:561 start_codon:yes stop_codon:yes gene_type:complete
MRESLFETLIGALVVAVAGAFLWFAIGKGTDVKASSDQYEVTARFNNISGVSRGTDVRIAGVKAGIVKAVEGDPKRFEAVVTMTLDEKWALPEDTDARISTDGLLGGSYVALEPGGSFDNIPQDGSGEIIYTRGSVDLLTLFASFASGSGGNGDSSGSSTTSDAAAEPAATDAPAGDDSYPDEDYQ